jgi:membrane protease YdiL (CAAX protease family)
VITVKTGNFRTPWIPITTVVGLLLWLAAVLLPIGAWSGRLFGPLWGGEVLWWILCVAIYAYVLVVEHRPLSSIGLKRPGWREIGLAVITALLMVAGIVFIYSVIFPMLHLKMNVGQMNKIINASFVYRFLLVTRAAVFEETLFRGYPIERIGEWSGSRMLGGLITWVAFTYAHLSGWGGAQLIVAGFGGLLLTMLFLWRGNLWANMLAHWLADGAGFLLPR